VQFKCKHKLKNTEALFSYRQPGQQIVFRWKWLSTFKKMSLYIIRHWRRDRNSCTVGVRVGFDTTCHFTSPDTGLGIGTAVRWGLE
jgi:hypothetical protein